jgi:hypothetical protein
LYFFSEAAERAKDACIQTKANFIFDGPAALAKLPKLLFRGIEVLDDIGP